MRVFLILEIVSCYYYAVRTLVNITLIFWTTPKDQKSWRESANPSGTDFYVLYQQISTG